MTASSSAPAITAWCSAAIWQMRPRHPAGRPPPAIRRRHRHRRGHGAGLLPQPAFHQPFSHQRDAVVQGPQPCRPRQLHHAALRVRPAASRRLGADLRPRPRGDAGQRRALLKEGRADLPRLEPQGRGDHRAHLFAGALLRPAAAGRARGAVVEERHRPRLPRGDPAPAVRHGQGAVRERARPAAVPVQDFAVRHLAGRHAVEDQADGLDHPRLRSAERLPALQGRLGQSGARRCSRPSSRPAGASRRRSSSTRSSSRAARRPASR